MIESQTYDENSIQSLDDRTHVRLRPAMYIGDTGMYGLHHLVYEIVDNSIDEITNGYGNLITCTIHTDGFVSVRDNGRGIPVGIPKGSDRVAAEIVLTSLRSGGKFNNKNYMTSAGLHGIGAAAVNFLSENFDVIIDRDGYTWSQSFKYGLPEQFLKLDESDKTGTFIKFKPDHKIFQTVDFQYKILHDRLKELAYLNKGVKIELIDERTNEKSDFYSEGGITAFIEDINKDKQIISPVIFFSQVANLKNDALGEYSITIETALQYTKTYSDLLFCFANNINTREGGTHLTGFKNALLESIEKYSDRKKLFKGMNIKLTSRDILEGLTAVVSVKLPNPELEGQTKSTLGNPEIKTVVCEQILESLQQYFIKNDTVAMAISEKIVQTCIAREEARKARETVRRKNILSSMSLPGKLADCQSGNPEICEIFITEGDSAAGSAKMGRDRKFQAVLALKGKVLNTEKNNLLTQILDNKEVQSLIAAIGYNIETGDLSKLRYNKVILMTDADVDGSHIRSLLMTLFYRYMKPLVETGHLYIAQPPLYKARLGKKDFYLNDDEALNAWRKTVTNPENAIITRFKGLGEMNADQLAESTMDIKTRRLARVVISDEEQTDKIFTILMGNDVEPRREYIIQNALMIDESEIDA